MSQPFLIGAGISALALAALILWALRGSRQRVGGPRAMKAITDAPDHVHHMGQIRQALDSADLEYAAQRGSATLAANVQKERRHVTLLYLAAIRRDFEQLLHIARVIAVLSPEVSGPDEYQRLRLALIFRCRYQIVRARLMMGNPALPQVTILGRMVTSLVSDLEAAMAALGERAALAAQLAAHSER